MRVRVPITFLAVLLVAVGAWAESPDVNAIVGRMQAAMQGRNHDLAYSVTREYKLSSDDPSKAARVIAEVNTIPGKKDYSITEGDGQAEKIVRKVLDHETESVNREHSAMLLSPENYEFAYAGTEAIDGHNCYVLQLTPRHDGRDIVKGRAWVDAQSYLVRQISGTPTKMPSFWIKDLQVTLHYKNVEGIWLQDSAEAIAQVRLAGRHVLTTRSLDVRTGTALADSKNPARKQQRRNDPALLGAGVFSQR